MLLASVLGRHSSKNAPLSLLISSSRSRTRFLQTQTKHAADLFRVLFMGRDEFSCLVLQELYQAKDVWAELTIATQPDVHVGRRGSVLSVSPLKILAESLNLPLHTIPKTRKEFRTWKLPHPFMQSTDTESPPPENHLLITASFGRILTDKMLSQFQPSHRLNVHPSLLPAYRGPAPLQHAIMNQDKETGVCVIKMLQKSEGIDAGSIWGCRKIDMPSDATYASLRDQLGTLGGQLLVSVLRDLLTSKAIPQEQFTTIDAPKAPSITAQDASVDFNSMSASQIDSRFRAISHQKPLFTHLHGKSVQLRQIEVVDASLCPADLLPTEPGWVAFFKKKAMLVVRCADGSLLGVTLVRPEGKADRKAHEFWNAVLQDGHIKGPVKQIFFRQSAPS